MSSSLYQEAADILRETNVSVTVEVQSLYVEASHEQDAQALPVAVPSEVLTERVVLQRSESIVQFDGLTRSEAVLSNL